MISLSPKVKRLATTLGLRQAEKFLAPSTIDDIDPKTAIAANVWALAQDDINEEPFPSVGHGDFVLSNSFDISWGRVWFQRQFWLLHKTSSIESRWINGRTAPMKTVKIN
mgnify:CR=1 FL=1